jgi:hypothetical protein
MYRIPVFALIFIVSAAVFSWPVSRQIERALVSVVVVPVVLHRKITGRHVRAPY